MNPDLIKPIEKTEERMSLCRQRAAQAWCEPTTSHKIMDTELALAFSDILFEDTYKPNLGCATTWQLLQELKARLEVSGQLDYRTIDYQ